MMFYFRPQTSSKKVLWTTFFNFFLCLLRKKPRLNNFVRAFEIVLVLIKLEDSYYYLRPLIQSLQPLTNMLNFYFYVGKPLVQNRGGNKCGTISHG